MLQNAAPLRKSAPRPPNSSDEHVSCTAPAIADPLQMSHACHRFWKCTSERPKVARACAVFHILTSKCASRHNGVHFFDNFEKCPKRAVLLPFSLANALRATTARTFSTSQLLKVLRP